MPECGGDPVNEAVAIIALQGSHVLLIRNRKRSGSIEIPGGALLPGESIVECAARELREETGLFIGSHQDLVSFHEKDTSVWHIHVLRALRWVGELIPGDDTSEAFWGSPDLILKGQRSEDYPTVMRALHLHKAGLTLESKDFEQRLVDYVWNIQKEKIPDVWDDELQWVPDWLERITPALVHKRKGMRRFGPRDRQLRCTVTYVRADSWKGKLILQER